MISSAGVCDWNSDLMITGKVSLFEIVLEIIHTCTVYMQAHVVLAVHALGTTA